MIGMLNVDEQPSLQPDKPEVKADAAADSTPAPEVKAADQPASPSEPAEAAPEGDKQQSASGADGSPETQEQKDKGEKKFTPKDPDVPAGVQKRIDKAIWEKHEAERKAEAAAREAEELRKRLEEKDQATGKPASEPSKPPEKPVFQYAEAEPKAPAQDDYETIEEYLQAHAQYARDLSSWQYRRDKAADVAEQQQAALQRQQQELQTTWMSKITEFEKSDPGIREAVTAVGPFLTQAQVADFIMQSEVGPEMVAYIAAHNEEWLPIAKTGDPRVVAREIGKLEARLTSSTVRKPAPKHIPESRDKSLPEPVLSVGGRAAPAKGVDLNDPKTSVEDWQKEFARQLESSSF